jgi:hypothetical protein
MKFEFYKIIGWFILLIGFGFYTNAVIDHDLNMGLIFLVCTLGLWSIYKVNIDSFDMSHFLLIISFSGLVLAVTLFLLFGVEETAFPKGALIFHSDGIAKSLGTAFISIIPLLFLHQTGDVSFTLPKPSNQPTAPIEPNIETSVYDEEEWEQISQEEANSGEFEIA